MEIYDSKQLEDLQKEFNNTFSYLKIEFFSSPHQAGVASDEVNILNPKLTIGEVQGKKTSGIMSLDKTMSIGDFEQLFKEKFDLNVQVYRISHSKWLQTWVTDVWTLEEQNNRGKIMSEINASSTG